MTERDVEETERVSRLAQCDSSGGVARAYSWYVLAVLTFAYSLAYVDRQVINLLVDPIRHDLDLTDTQLSLVQGLAFISAYLASVPVFGRLVDIGHPRNILMAGVAAWSTFAALIAGADSYAELFLARVGLGAAEGCVIPACWSLIGDYFSRKKLTSALGIFALGPLLGGGFSLVAGGAVIAFADRLRFLFPPLADFSAWQLTFIAVALPGAALVLVLLSVRQPSRSRKLRQETQDRQFTLANSLKLLWESRQFYARCYFGMGMVAVVALGVPAWLPSFLIRFHGVDQSLVGYTVGIITIIAGIAGVLSGPLLARTLEGKGFKDGALRVVVCSTCGLALCAAILPFAPGTEGALAAAAGLTYFSGMPMGVMMAVLLGATPARIRGLAGSLYSFAGNLIGYGIGPTAIALVTDRIFADPIMVGYSLGLVGVIAACLATWLYAGALPHYRRLLEEREAEEQNATIADAVAPESDGHLPEAV